MIGRDPTDFAMRLRGDHGVVGGVEVLPFGVLIFVVGSLLVANAWAVVDTKFMVTSAAREAARTYVEAPDQGTAMARARIGVADAISGQGRNPNHAHIRVDHDNGRPWGRCVRVRRHSGLPSPGAHVAVDRRLRTRLRRDRDPQRDHRPVSGRFAGSGHMLTADDGSALILMPAAVLVVMVLAAITMDLSLVHLGRRETIAAAEAAANDAATFGLDERAYRSGAGYRLDAVRARSGHGAIDRCRRAHRRARVAARDDDRRHDGSGSAHHPGRLRVRPSSARSGAFHDRDGDRLGHAVGALSRIRAATFGRGRAATWRARLRPRRRSRSSPSLVAIRGWLSW